MIHKWFVYFLTLIIAIAVFPATSFAQDGLPLTQTYYSPDGRFSLAYPAGWVVQGAESAVSLATDAGAVQANTALESGQARVASWLAPSARRRCRCPRMPRSRMCSIS